PASTHHSAHLQVLHSFPTRRSSDLIVGQVGRRWAARCRAGHVLVVQEKILYLLELCRELFEIFRLDPGCRFTFRFHKVEALESQDRKSTRLNSSHQIISYAVFCLKK